MHHVVDINAGGHSAQTSGGFIGVPPPCRRRQDERAASTEAPDFLGETIERTDAEDDARGGLVVKKRAHSPTISNRLAHPGW